MQLFKLAFLFVLFYVAESWRRINKYDQCDHDEPPRKGRGEDEAEL